MSNTQGGTSREITVNKPKWVEALESAEKALRLAEEATDSATQSSRNALAHTWLAIAREYRESA